VLEESVHDRKCVVTAQLQQEPSFVIYVSIAVLADSHPSIPRRRSQRSFLP